jgi:hypothetical protein
VKELLYLVLVWFVVTRPQLRALWRQLDRPRQVFLALLFGLILIGQFSAQKYPTCPFVKWGMYASGSSRVRYVEYRGVRSDGSEAPFPIERLVRTYTTPRAIECATCGKRFLWRMRSFTNALEYLSPGPQRDEVWDLYQRTLRAAWQIYKRRHPEADFQSVRVFRNRTTVPDFENSQRDSITSTPLWQVTLEEGA